MLNTDVYSSWIIVFDVINFNRPFKEIDAIYDRQRLNRQINSDYKYETEIIHKISEVVKNLIYKLLEPNHQKRTTTKEVLSHCWPQ